MHKNLFDPMFTPITIFSTEESQNHLEEYAFLSSAAQEAIESREEHLRSLIDCSPTAILLTDEDGRIIEWNPAFERICGLTRSDVIGKYAWDVFLKLLPADLGELAAKRMEQGIKEVIQTGIIPDHFRPHLAPIKSSMDELGYLEVYPFVIKTKKGFRLGINALIVAERKQLQDAYEKLVNSSLQGIAIFQDWRLVYANSAWSRMTGYSLDELKAMPFEQMDRLCHPEDVETVMRAYEQSLAAHKEAQHQAKILQVLASASSRLIQIEQFDQAVLDTLAEIQQLTKAKQVIVVECEDNSEQIARMVSYPTPSSPCLEESIVEDSFQRFEWQVQIAPKGFLGIKKDPSTPEWQEDILTFLHTVAQMFGNAFQQRYLLQTLEQRVKARTRELNALYELASITSATLDSKTILQVGLRVAFKAFETCHAAAFIVNPRTNALQLAAFEGGKLNRGGKLIIRKLKQRARKLLNQRGPLLITTNTSGKKSSTQSALKRESFLGISLVADDQVWGCLCVLADEHSQFTPEDVALLSAVADQLNQTRERSALQLHLRRLAVDEERQRLARELHDAVTQSVYSLSLLASASQQAMNAGKISHVNKYLEILENNALQALKEMRLFLYELRCDVLCKEGFVKALARRLELVERRSNIDARLIVEGDVTLSEEQEVELYGIAQEALNNSLKHAAARSVTVQLKGTRKQILLQIQDDGIGFDVNACAQKCGMGLISLQERTKRLRGRLQLHSSGNGTLVQVIIPRVNKKGTRDASFER